MTNKSFFSRRLSKKKEILSRILDKDPKEIQAPLNTAYDIFCRLDASMLYGSHLGENDIGVAAVYLAREDKSACLVAVKVDPSHRNEATTQVIRSALPIFRTANIHNVTAVVAMDSKMKANRFPLSNYLEKYNKKSLERIGFEEVGQAKCGKISGISKPLVMSKNSTEEHDPKAATSLISSCRKQSYVISPNIWMNLELARQSQSILTCKSEDEEVLMAYAELKQELVFPVFLTSPNAWLGSVMNLFELDSEDGGFKSVLFPFLSEPQTQILERLAEEVEGELTTSRLVFMKKDL